MGKMSGRSLTRLEAVSVARWFGRPVARRCFAALAVVLLMLPAFAFQPADAQTRRGAEWGVCAPGVLLAGYSDALDGATFDGHAVGGLSDLAYDARRDVYYAVVDNQTGVDARFFTLSISRPASRGFDGPQILDSTWLYDADGMPFDETNFDGEGMAVTIRGTVLISSETEPSIREFSTAGELLRELPIPERFLVEPDGQGQVNATLESLTVTPSGRYVYSATSERLLSDGADQLRFMRHWIFSTRRAGLDAEFYYQAEPGQSIGAIHALSETELLVLERSFTPDVGNMARVFLTTTAGATDVSDIDSLDGANIAPLPKQELVDIVDCPPGDASVRQPQPNPLLDSYDGIAPGPKLPNGYQVFYLVSDNNFNPIQVTRVLALAIDLDLLEWQADQK